MLLAPFSASVISGADDYCLLHTIRSFGCVDHDAGKMPTGHMADPSVLT
jgi:hypothetical protein